MARRSEGARDAGERGAPVSAPKRTKPSLALEAAALAYAAAVASLGAEREAIIAEHVSRTGSAAGALATAEAQARLGPLRLAREVANGAMGRAAVALWKAERRRGAARV